VPSPRRFRNCERPRHACRASSSTVPWRNRRGPALGVRLRCCHRPNQGESCVRTLTRPAMPPEARTRPAMVVASPDVVEIHSWEALQVRSCSSVRGGYR
jgi:hypothetical protein